VPPSPTPVVDRLGTVTPEPLSPGDALEMYQQVSQKVQISINVEYCNFDLLDITGCDWNNTSVVSVGSFDC
jgi:hypothetical protein